jgi:histidine kinase
MNILQLVRERLGWKLFLSYLVIIVVSAVVLAGTAQFHAPTVLQRHIERMQAVLGEHPGLADDLYQNFDAAINEILAISSLFSLAAAVIVSLFVTRRIVGPIRVMRQASRSIAAGDYHERIPVPSGDELGVLAGAFNRMAEELEQTEQRRLDLIGNVAHELRTPLSSIRATMEGVIDRVLPAEEETFLGVQREISRLQRLVHDLEELSRAEAGQIVLEKQPIFPHKLIQEAVSRLALQYESKGVDLSTHIAADLPPVLVDPGRITQVLLNLLGNALQYTPGGGKVMLDARRADRELVIEIRDEGIGIPAEHLPHLFERFYRVDKSRSRAGGGSGIGLTISKLIVEAHGGHIFASSPGHDLGSTFTFTLPVKY